MRTSLFRMAMLGICLRGLAAADAATAQSFFDGGAAAFTDQQAARGQIVYTESCGRCHGRHLDDGQFGPPLKGAGFKAHWHDQSAEKLWTSLFRRMPPADPSVLPARAYTDVEAYLLRENGESPGAAPLVVSTAAMAAPVPEGPAVAPESQPSAARLENRDATYQAALAARKSLLAKVSPVTDATLRDPPAADWLMWRGSYSTLAYSALDQINRHTVGKLGVAWTLALPPSANETAPLIHDGILFVTSANLVEAIDATNGAILWQYVRALPEELHAGREARMRGLAIYGDTLYAPTADGHIVALAVHTGELRWDHAVVTPEQNSRPGIVDGAYFHISGGPLLVHGKVIVGVSLGIDTGGGDYIVGLDAQTGAQLWRFDTIARPGQPGGDSWNGAPVEERFGSGVWSIGSYDPDLNLVYFGTGNTYDAGTLLVPRGQARLSNNDALYTDSTVALDPDSGKLVWYYQHMNRDVWDLDWVFEQSLVTLPINGTPTRVLVTGGKIGIFDAVNRATGHYLFSKDVGIQNLVGGIDPQTGRKLIRPELEPVAGRTDLVCPVATGVRNWPTTAIDPTVATLFVPLVDNYCMQYSWAPRSPADIASGGQDMRLRGLPRPGNDGNFGRIDAIDLKTGRVLWSLHQRVPIASSLLTSAGGLLFAGSRDRQFRAYDASDGKVLWQTTLNASPSSSPATYSVAGVQYLVVIAGGGGAFDSSSRSLTPELIDPPGGMTAWVFRLPQPSP